MKKNLIFISLSFFVLLLFLFFGNSRDQKKNFVVQGNSFIEGLRIFHKKDGNSMWKLTARRADIMDNQGIARLKDVAIIVEDKGMAIYAGDGVYDIENHNLTLNGMITAVTKDYTIIADSIELDNSTGTINTAQGVRVEGKKFTVEGIGMNADSNQNVRILKNVKAIFYR
ncbi:MAG: LPS export ABC transporter periplasmic protein LptC [Nitrospirae bacterium]|nr:LPS export ABC transporter periplasmic protein LptC [Nitrospirota bacterium]